MTSFIITRFIVPAFFCLIVIILICFYLDRIKIKEQIRPIKKGEWISVLLIVFIAIFIRQYWVFHTHNVYFDEFRHMYLAQTFLSTGLFGAVSQADLGQAPVVRAVKWPPGFHVFLSIAYGLFGIKESVAYWVNACWGGLGVLFAWLFIRLLKFTKETALISAGVICFWPLHLRMCGGTSLEPSAMAAVFACAAVLLLYFEIPTKPMTIAAITGIGLVGLFRVDGVLSSIIIPGLLYVNHHTRYINRFSYKYLLYAGIAWFPLFMIWQAGRHSYSMFPAFHHPSYFLTGFTFWFSGGLLPYVYFVTILGGSVLLFKQKPLLAAAGVLNIIFMTAVYGLYQSVDISFLDHQRFQLLCAPGLVLLSAGFFEGLLKFKSRIFIGIVLGLFFLSAFLHLPYSQKPFRLETEMEYRFVIAQKGTLPKNAIYFTAVPEILKTVINLNGVPTKWLIEPPQMLSLKDAPLIYFKDIWPHTHPRFKTYDAQIQSTHNLKPIAETVTPKGKIGFYQLIKKY